MSVVRRQISIAASPRTVWAAVTTGEGLGKWLAPAARADGREGGRIVLTRGEAEEAGIFHSFRPTARAEVKWTQGPWKGTMTQFSVARDGTETVLAVHHSGTPFQAEDVRQGADGFWKQALTTLRDALEGS